jgi:xanthine dehydrogenase accessory factor
VNSLVRDRARRWLDGGTPGVVVEVTEARGSVPREAGTRMVVGPDAVLGTIGGGHLELKAIATARTRLASAAENPVEEHFALGPALGQCCGGAVTLRYAPLSAGLLAAWRSAPPRFTLQLYGAGHVGRAIAGVLAGIDCRVQWIDERESEFPRGVDLPPHIEQVCVEPVQAEVALAPAGAFYLVLTHSHDLDLAITEAILKRGDFGFLGLIGSQTKRARFVRRFEQRGIAPAMLARLTCPIGLPGIEGKEPEVIAVAVVAQLLQRAVPDAAKGTAPDFEAPGP